MKRVTTVPSPNTSTAIMSQENQMKIVIKEFNKFKKKETRSAKQQRLENLLLLSWRSISCTCRKGTPLFGMISSMKWLIKNLIYIKVMTICI